MAMISTIAEETTLVDVVGVIFSKEDASRTSVEVALITVEVKEEVGSCTIVNSNSEVVQTVVTCSKEDRSTSCR